MLSYRRLITFLSFVSLLAVFVATQAPSTKAATPQDFVAQVPGFPVSLPSGAIKFGSPTVADINGDGKSEIIVGGSDGVVSALTGSGQLL